jgi:phenylalanine ammonia-lyase
MQSEFQTGLADILRYELQSHFGSSFAEQLYPKCQSTILASLEHTSSMDCVDRMNVLAESCTAPLVNHFLSLSTSSGLHLSSIEAIPAFRGALSVRCVELYASLRREYLTGERGSAPAARYLNRTRGVYEYVRNVLEIKMHGKENLDKFTHTGMDGLIGMPGGDDGTIGENVTRIYEVRFS